MPGSAPHRQSTPALLLMAVALLVAAPAPCAEPYLVKDTSATLQNQGEFLAKSSPRNMVEVNGTIFFWAADHQAGRELWKTDGTAEGTVLVKDLQPGFSDDSSVGISTNGYFVFEFEDASTGEELWRSDGTWEGTVLLKDIYPGPTDGFGGFGVTVGDTHFFTARDPDHGFGLWKTDGTTTGTVMVSALTSGHWTGPYPELEMVEINGTVFFLARTGQSPLELWKSDGATSGTEPVAILSDDFSYNAPDFGRRSLMYAANHQLFVAVPEQNINEVTWWRSDGTTSGTMPTTFVIPQDHAVLGNTTFFARTDAEHGSELWKSDGTPEGTEMVIDILPGADGSQPRLMTSLTDKFCFFATDSSGESGFWSSDGTATGTLRLASVDPNRVFSNGRVLYISAFEGQKYPLWYSDGTSDGTMKVKDDVFINWSFRGIGLVSTDDRLFFSGAPDFEGQDYELWISDGTTAGTVQLKDIATENLGSLPGNFVAVGDTLYFVVQENFRSWQLWKTNGTESDTVVIRDFNVHPGLFDAVGNKLFLWVYETGRYYPWISDGTLSGTERLCDAYVYFVYNLDYPSAYLNAGRYTYFRAESATHGQELWRTDGTTSGTIMLRDIYPGSSDSNPRFFTHYRGKLYFTANDGIHGQELWTSDGTPSGTVMVKDIDPNGDAFVYNLTRFQDILMFTAVGPDGTYGLWKTDGTSNGTQLVFNEPMPYPPYINLYDAAVIFDTIFGWWRTDGATEGTYALNIETGLNSKAGPLLLGPERRPVALMPGRADGVITELWRMDGTVGGSVLIRAFERPGFNLIMSPINIFSGDLIIDNVAYFAAFDSTHGFELWRSDGTMEGTHILKDINPGFRGSHPEEMKLINGTLYFRATDGVHGSELWQSDGTEAGTRMVADLAPGRLNSNPVFYGIGPFTRAGNLIYFTADDASGLGVELWALDLGSGAVSPWWAYR